MRPVNPDLEALLASTRQVAIWEEFTFDLADGAQVVYSTRDADALPPVEAPPPPPPPPPPSVWPLLDTFAGAANSTLASHVGNSGNVWFGWDGYSASDVLLTGDGAVYVPVSDTFFWDGRRVATDGAPPDDLSDFYLEANVVLSAPGGAVSVASADFMVSNGNLGALSGFFMQLLGSPSSSAIDVEGYVMVNYSVDPIGTVSTGLSVGSTPIKLRMEVTNNRKTLTVFVNGTNKGSATASVAPSGLVDTHVGIFSLQSGEPSLVQDVAGDLL